MEGDQVVDVEPLLHPIQLRVLLAGQPTQMNDGMFAFSFNVGRRKPLRQSSININSANAIPTDQPVAPPGSSSPTTTLGSVSTRATTVPIQAPSS